MWDAMSEAQRIELSRQESANILSVGIWFENILNQALLRALLHNDPSSLHTRYMLTEMGDECRHMTMFGRAIEQMGAKPSSSGGTRPSWSTCCPGHFAEPCSGWPR